MTRYVAKRLLLAVPTVLGVVTLVFLMRFVAPGDPARLMLGEQATPESIAALRAEWGLDQSVIEQYMVYIGKLATLDLGVSYKSGDAVLAEILQRFPATLELSIVAMIIATSLGVLAGVYAATRRNKLGDYLTMIVALAGVSVPIFWLALMLIITFSVQLDLFPTGGRLSGRMFLMPITGFMTIDSIIQGFREGTAAYFLSALNHLVLPAVVLATVPLAVTARVTRSAMLEVLNKDYIKTARAKGLPERQVIWRHALKNAILPVITIIGIMFGYNLAGAVLTENIFAWPGIGNWLFNAVLSRDYLAIQGGVAFVAVVFIAINLLVDVLYAWFNPRIRY